MYIASLVIPYSHTNCILIMHVGRSSGKAAHGRKSAALESSQNPKLC